MSSLQDAPVISFDSPPPSPIQTISFEDVYTSEEVAISPKRRRRNEMLSKDHGESHQLAVSVEPGQKPDGSELDPAFSMFVESVMAEECSFWQLSRTLFVVNGWDIKHGLASSAWYHVHQVITGIGKSIACFCPAARQSNYCFHVRFLQQHGDEKFPIDIKMPADDTRTYLFSRYIAQNAEEDSLFHNTFSVPSGGATGTVKNRAIVDHYGHDDGSGKWSCSKDTRIHNCGHILSARKCLQQHIKQDPCAEDINGKKGDIVFEDYTLRKASQDSEAVSYKPRYPPIWVRIASDPCYPSIRNAKPIPELIRLENADTCCCNPFTRTRYDTSKPVITMPCDVYGLTKAWTSLIEVQKCTKCRYRFIGPDCRQIGIFNWNNRVLFTHELLDDYTSTYCTSETPFIAWVTVVSRRYELHASPKAFVSDKKFRSIWFAYAKLMELNGDMTCPKCGPTPKATIWDGVTLSFSRKHLLPTLRPPTKLHKNSPIRVNTKYSTMLQYLPEKFLRKSLKRIAQGPTYVDQSTLELLSLNSIESRYSSTDSGVITHAPDRSDLFVLVIKGLSDLDFYLAQLFERSYSIPSLRSKGLAQPHEVYRQFFLQIAAEESALQLAPRPTLTSLAIFMSNPTLSNISFLTSFPALYNLLLYEFNHNLPSTSLPEDTLGVCKWLLLRGLTVLYSMLSTSETTSNNFSPDEDTGYWLQTGSCYSMPQVRHRPFYPQLSKDGQLDKTGKDGNSDICQKYYTAYGQKRLTGGLMMVWCTHSICYGFHCIPMTEGRNEVFSALYTHWQKAPEIVIYDFACSLQPYCMAREPEFFADTSFLIDHFHSAGHTKCGQASFLSNYIKTNPGLMEINSSAAECGNGGLLRIRKSVSYMSQEHAILYTKVYVSYWNRARIQKMGTVVSNARP